MSQKYKCNDIWSLWEKGWICIPTAPDNSEDRFPTPLGRYLVDRFPGLEKNYGRICTAERGPYAIFRSTFSKVDPEQKMLVYHDQRDPLSPGDNGLILLPDMAGSIDNKEDSEETDWEIIEKTVEYIQENRRLIPGPIFLPPLGFGEDRMEEEDAVDDLMGLLLKTEDVFIMYDIHIPEEDIEEETKEEEEEISEPTKPPDFGKPKPEPQEEYVSTEGSLIQNEFETIEVRLPETKL